MSRLNCVGAPRHYSRLHPSVWAGYKNEWKFLEELSDEFDSSTKAKISRKWRQHAAHPRHGILRLPIDGAHITSQKAVQYGYFETCFQASDSPLGSSFLLISEADPNVLIRAFSYSGAENARHRVVMDAVALVKGNNNQEKYLGDPLEKHIFSMPETPVIVGVDWTPEHITTYVDGHVIRQMENKHWHSPMQICFSLCAVKSTDYQKTSSPRWWKRDHRNSARVSTAFEVYYIRGWHRHPDHRKRNAPGVEVSPTHYQKTTSSSTHRGVHYKKSQKAQKRARISLSLRI